MRYCECGDEHHTRIVRYVGADIRYCRKCQTLMGVAGVGLINTLTCDGDYDRRARAESPGDLHYDIDFMTDRGWDHRWGCLPEAKAQYILPQRILEDNAA